jgi:hypothetical protein
VVSICAWANPATVVKVSAKVIRLRFEKNMGVPKVRQLGCQLRHPGSGKCVANRARKMNLKIERFAVFWAGRSLCLSSLKPFCGKKICILSNGFSSELRRLR